ncbi:MAG: tetratricopeptide repeat protein, partial [Armatimonadota bacterium]|nr:tetratricopeptide repeat protein [Armatimonadota bacterium]
MKSTLGTVVGIFVLTAGAACAQAPAKDNNAQSPYQVVSGASGSAADQNALRQAIADFKANKLAESAAGLQALEKKSPSNVTAHSLLGYIYLKQGKNDQAVAEMETVVKLAPGDVGGRKNLGRAYLQVGRDNEAIAQFKAVLARSPQDTDALYGQALAQAQTGSGAEAAAGFRQVIALKPTSAAYQNLGVVLQKSGKNAEAADAFRQAATLDPQNAVAWLNAGLLYAQTGAGAKAIPALTQA